MSEAEGVRDTISKLTGAKFEIREAENLPERFGHPVWFMRCREITQANKIPHVNSLWREDGNILIESLTLGNTSQWIEENYGEEAVYPVLDTDITDFANPQFRKEFLRPFPAIQQRLDSYDMILKRVSKKHGTELAIRYDGGKGLAVFYLDATVKSDEKNTRLIIKRLEKAIRALREAYGQIELQQENSTGSSTGRARI
jgi:hypothetical protein